jgi:hypothetical protein
MPAPTITQHKSTFAINPASGGAITATFTSSVTAGNMILALVGAAHNSNNASAVTINTPTMTGETFTAWANSANAGSSNNGQTAIFAVNSAAGGQTSVSVTVTYAGGTSVDVHLHIIEVHGQAGSPRDIQGNTESTTMSVSTSGTTTTANDLIIGFFYDDINNITFTHGGSYAQVEQSNNSTSGDAAFSESLSVSSTGTQIATATGNGTDIVEQSIIAIAGTGAGGLVFEDDSFKVQTSQQFEPIVSIWG